MELTEREKIVLENIIHHFVEYAEPVGSNLLAKISGLNLSSASIRNIMAGLEKKGLIRQPHISAGRIPTQRGYRVYVDVLMKKTGLTPSEKELIYRAFKEEGLRHENVLEIAARLLANISHQLTILVSPGLEDSIFEKIEIIPLTDTRVILVLSVNSGFIKTINLEIAEKVEEKDLRELSVILNDRLCGHKIATIQHRLQHLLKGVPIDKYGIVKLFLRNSPSLFHFQQDHKLLYEGTTHLLGNPEFRDPQKATGILALVETGNPIVQLIDAYMPHTVYSKVIIGDEIPLTTMHECSIVTSKYMMGNLSGSVSVIGPMRMNYAKLMAVLEFTAKTITELYTVN